MKDFELQFKFKGDRTYVHGTDIYNLIGQHLSKEFQDIRQVNLSLNKIAKGNMKCRFLEENETSSKDSAAVFTFYSKNVKHRLVLEESLQEIISKRYEYNEEEIYRNGKVLLDQKEIILTEDVKFSNIEIYVALNKFLLNKLFSTVDGKWYFTRFEADEFSFKKNYQSISVKFISSFNLKLTKSLVFVDGERVGNIYFSLVK